MHTDSDQEQITEQPMNQNQILGCRCKKTIAFCSSVLNVNVKCHIFEIAYYA